MLTALLLTTYWVLALKLSYTQPLPGQLAMTDYRSLRFMEEKSPASREFQGMLLVLTHPCGPA